MVQESIKHFPNTTSENRLKLSPKAIFLNMHKDNPTKSFVFSSRSGCFFPSLIILNLFFGWIIFKPRYWIIIEAILLLFFMVNTYVIGRKIFSSVSKKYDDAIDVKGEVVEDRQKRKEILDER